MEAGFSDQCARLERPATTSPVDVAGRMQQTEPAVSCKRQKGIELNVRLTLQALLLTLTLLPMTGGGGASGAFAAAAVQDAPRARVVFPLRAEPGKRYLTDAEGRAFLLNGEAAWSLISELTRAEVDLYLADRQRRGFNAVLVRLLERRFATNAPRNRYGVAPFTTPGDYSTPDERYFAHADDVIRKAAEKGILVLLAPSYLGFQGGDQGWYREMVANGPEKLREYGRYLGRRYRTYTNILWVHGGDFDPPEKALVREIALGIREFDTRSLHTTHGARGTAALRYWPGESWLTVNNIYVGRPAYLDASREYHRSGMPFFLIEGRYENEAGSEGTAQRVRSEAYHALLSGAMGHVFGNNPIWHFSGPGLYPVSLTWQQALDSPGARSMTALYDLFATVSWWTLIPDQANDLLTGGVGSGRDRAVAARAGDGSVAIAYLPSVRPVVVDLGRLAGPRVAAHWYDPASGAYAATAGAPFPASGSRSFRPPGHNSSGFGDWVLVLKSRDGG